MGLVVNPRGTAGAGKTELVRRLMWAYGWRKACDGKAGVEPIVQPGRACPLGYRLQHPLRHRPLAVLGHYEKSSGGCDTIGVKDGGMAAIFALARDYAASGHDVLIEGLELSGEWQRTAALARACPFHVLALTTPPETAARNLARRRRASRRAVPLMTSTTAAQHEKVAAACERLRPHARVHRLSFDEALARARELLCLDVRQTQADERP